LITILRFGNSRRRIAMDEFQGTFNGRSVIVRIESTGSISFREANGFRTVVYVYSRPTVSRSELGGSILSIEGTEFVFSDPEAAGAIAGRFETKPVRKSPMSNQGSSAPITQRNVYSSSPGYRSPAFSRARAAASIVEFVGWLAAIIGPIAGLIVIFGSNDSSGTTSDSIDGQSSVLLGLIIMVSTVIQGIFLIMIGAYIQGRSDQ
ncbi:MAG: hypothetical protein ACKOD2_07650, partial [Ilumatobacteraceae bacterium]